MGFSTTSELAVFTEKELGHSVGVGGSSQRADIVSHLDRAHKIILGGGGILNYNEKGQRLHESVIFPFARSLQPKILTLIAPITNVNVSASRLSNSITFDAAPNGAANVANLHIRINSEPEVYKILTSANSSTSATLDGSYVGASNVTNAACDIFQLQYNVGSSDVLQLISPLRAYNNISEERRIDLVDKDELLKQRPMSQVAREFPERAAIVKESLGTITIQLDSYPDDISRVELDYIPIPSTLDTTSVDPILPVQFRLSIAYLAAYLIATRNNDNRATAFLQQARMEFLQLMDWNTQLMTGGDENFGRVRLVGFRSKKRVATVKGYSISN